MKTYTKEQLEKMYGTGFASQLPQIETTPTKQSLASKIKEAFSTRVGKAQEAQTKGIQGQQSLGSATLQTIGQGAGFVGDVIGETVMSAGKAVLPQRAEQAIASGVQSVFGSKPVQEVVSQYQTFKEKYPEASADIEAIFNIGSLIPIGAVGGATGRATTRGVANVVDTAGNVADTAMSATRGVGSKITDVITPIESATETAFNPTRLIPKEQLKNIPINKINAVQESKAIKLDNYLKQAEKAVADYSQKTPLQVAGDKATDALTVINNKLAKQGQLKQEALGVVGDKTVSNVPKLRTSLKDTLRERVGINIDTQTGEIIPATGRVSKISLDPADNKMVKDVIGLFDSLGTNPTVRQVDDAIDAVQDILYKRKVSTAVPVNSAVESAFKQFTGQLNKSVKKVAGEQYRKANDKFAYMIDARDKLNKALGTEGVRGASLMKQLFSPSGEAPRRLFEEIKKLTGIDLVEEATFAKFVMENVGDARQASLLEEVIRGGSVTPRSFIGTAIERTLGKLQDPVGKAKRTIQQGKK
jgi:hypothetical protein